MLRIYYGYICSTDLDISFSPIWSSTWSARPTAQKHGFRSSSKCLSNSHDSSISWTMHIWMTECFLHLAMHWFQMGWSEELSEPTKAASVLRHHQRNQSLRQVLQEFAFLLDSWSWALCKSKVPPISSHVKFLNLALHIFSWDICSLIAGAGWPALYRTEHDQQHNPVTSKLNWF